MIELPLWVRLLVDWLLVSIIVSLIVGPLLRDPYDDNQGEEE